MIITIIEVANPFYSNSNNSTIDVTLTTEELGVIPFTASPNDSEAHGIQLYNDLVAGKYGAISAYVAPPPPPTPIPDLATQLATILISNGTIKPATLHPSTLAQINTQTSTATTALKG